MLQLGYGDVNLHTFPDKPFPPNVQGRKHMHAVEVLGRLKLQQKQMLTVKDAIKMQHI